MNAALHQARSAQPLVPSGGGHGMAWTSGRLRLTAAAILAAGAAGAEPTVQGPATAPASPCVAVQVGDVGAGELDCLNAALKSAADEAHPPSLGARPDARAPAHAVGLAVPTASRLRLGLNPGDTWRPRAPSAPPPRSAFAKPVP